MRSWLFSEKKFAEQFDEEKFGNFENPTAPTVKKNFHLPLRGQFLRKYGLSFTLDGLRVFPFAVCVSRFRCEF